MNSVANGKIRERTPFHDVYIQPGVRRQRHRARRGVLRLEPGAAAAARLRDAARLLGPRVRRRCRIGRRSTARARRPAMTLGCAQIRHDRRRRRAVRLDGRPGSPTGSIVGWFQGRMEWGARALGNRSILADPRRADMREIINTQDQVPREVPPVRAVGAAKTRRPTTSRARCPTRS